MFSRHHHEPPRSNYSAADQPACRKTRNSGYSMAAGDFVDTGRRRGNRRIPDDPGFILNEVQSRALSGIEYAGWDICFLRDRPFLDPQIVIHNREDDRFGILDIDGRIWIPDDLQVRAQNPRGPAHKRPQAQNLAYITV